MDRESNIIAQLPDVLLPWYRANRRELPWRQDRKPYHIWISEIMLQQTRVEAVKGYYTRFLDALPSVDALAEADDELLHKLWEGLGYYSRVRNLKKAAKVVMAEHGGVFPTDYASVRKLPGIGPYTAGAICSIAYDMPVPAVDGNVLRVVSRLTNDSTPIDLPENKISVEQRLKSIYPPEAGAFTQALMELGATVCGPNRKPDCESCPCKAFCLGNHYGTAESLPVKLPKRGRKVEEMTVFILSCEGVYAIEKRAEKGLLASLWQFPNVPGKLEPPSALRELEKQGFRPRDILRQTERKHIFTHVQWDMNGFYIEVAEQAGEYIWADRKQLQSLYALPTAFRQFLDDLLP